jgi:hypothetical protein
MGLCYHLDQVGVTVTILRSYVTGSNDAILNDVSQTMAVSLVGAHHEPGGALGHSFGTPPRGLRWATTVLGPELV